MKRALRKLRDTGAFSYLRVRPWCLVVFVHRCSNVSCIHAFLFRCACVPGMAPLGWSFLSFSRYDSVVLSFSLLADCNSTVVFPKHPLSQAPLPPFVRLPCFSGPFTYALATQKRDALLNSSLCAALTTCSVSSVYAGVYLRWQLERCICLGSILPSSRACAR